MSLFRKHHVIIATVVGFGVQGPSLCIALVVKVHAAACKMFTRPCCTIAGVKAAADANKKRLGFLSGILLALVPWMQVSKAVKQNVHMPLKGLLAVVAAGAGIHCLMLAFNLAAVHLLKLGGPSEEGRTWRLLVPVPVPVHGWQRG